MDGNIIEIQAQTDDAETIWDQGGQKVHGRVLTLINLPLRNSAQTDPSTEIMGEPLALNAYTPGISKMFQTNNAWPDDFAHLTALTMASE